MGRGLFQLQRDLLLEPWRMRTYYRKTIAPAVLSGNQDIIEQWDGGESLGPSIPQHVEDSTTTHTHTLPFEPTSIPGHPISCW